jgi:phage tail-like protein
VSCGPVATTFRLLDGWVGWDPAPPDGTKGLEGLGPGETLALARVQPGATDPNLVDGRIPPPPLAHGCGPCEWLLVTPGDDGRLLRRSCSAAFLPVDGELGCCARFVDARALAAEGHWVAVSDAGAGQVIVADRGGEQVVAVIAVAHPGALALSGRGDLLVADTTLPRLYRFDRTGRPRGMVTTPGLVTRIAIGKDCAVWIVTGENGGLHIYRAPRETWIFTAATVDDFLAAFDFDGITVATDLGFCLQELDSDGVPAQHCYDWCGQPLGQPIAPAPPPARVKLGQLLTRALDSGEPRCRWHRVRIDADVPKGTRLWVDVATSEEAEPPYQGTPDPAWPGFPTGPLHPEDWQTTSPDGPLDFLIRQPPGRHLFLRLRLSGDGVQTPLVRRIRIDLPRSTSLEHLPAVFRETPEAEDFTERFLSLFDATIARVDEAVLRAPALADGQGLPDEVLPWLAAFLDIVFDSAWTPAQRRALLAAAPSLYRRRGTKQGLIDTITIVTGVAPAIVELALERSWGGLGHAYVGGVRLYSRVRARFVVGSSAIGAAPMRSFGNPDQDPFAVAAFRFQVLVPPNALGHAQYARERLAELVESIKPAHTIAQLRVGGGGFVVGVSSAAGVDTVLGGLPPPVLGKSGTVRLGRMSVLAPARRGRRFGFAVGQAAVGVGTVMR